MEVATSITHIHPQQINPSKMGKKELHIPAEASKEKWKEKRPVFREIRPCKQRQEERFKMVEFQDYNKSKTNSVV